MIRFRNFPTSGFILYASMIFSSDQKNEWKTEKGDESVFQRVQTELKLSVIGVDTHTTDISRGKSELAKSTKQSKQNYYH